MHLVTYHPMQGKLHKQFEPIWMVENNLHWTLDVVFNEDQSRVRKDHAGENMAIVRHIVINMLNKAKGAFKGVALKALRKKAGWDNDTLSFILKQGLT